MLNYRNVDNIVYEYRINGGRWQRTREGENAITFTNLQPDKYVIEVRAVYGGTAYSKPAVFTISISHPWYSSTLARLVYALAFIALVYLIIRIIIKRQKDEPRRAEDALPHQCHTRHTIAADTHHGPAGEVATARHRCRRLQRP